MKYSAESLLHDIELYADLVLQYGFEDDWVIYNYLIDLYYLKFGVNLRLSNKWYRI